MRKGPYYTEDILVEKMQSGFCGNGWFRISYCVSEKTILNSKEAFKKAVESK